jgi:hypothetical protein
MYTLRKLLLFVLIAATFSSCLVHPRPYKKWTKKHNTPRYHNGNNYGGRKYWVRQH